MTTPAPAGRPPRSRAPGRRRLRCALAGRRRGTVRAARRARSLAPALVWPLVLLLGWPAWRVAGRVPAGAGRARRGRAARGDRGGGDRVARRAPTRSRCCPAATPAATSKRAISLAENHSRVVRSTPGGRWRLGALDAGGHPGQSGLLPGRVGGRPGRAAAVRRRPRCRALAGLLGRWRDRCPPRCPPCSPACSSSVSGCSYAGWSATAGDRWPAAATAVVYPIVHTGRSTLSEPLADLALIAGCLALVAAAEPGGRRSVESAVVRRAGAVAGLLVGATMLLRADALRETVLLTVVAALGLVQRRSWAGPALRWVWGSTAYAALAALWLSYRYLGDIAPSLVPLAGGAVLVGLVAAMAVGLSRRGVHLPAAVSRPLSDLAGVGTLLVGLVLATRPWWQTVRQNPDDPGARYVAGLQLRQGLAVDGGRTYAEQTVAWLSWWVGPRRARRGTGRPRRTRPRPRSQLGRRSRPAGVARSAPPCCRVDPAHALPAGHHAGPPVGRASAAHRLRPRRGPRRRGRRVRLPLGVRPLRSRARSAGRRRRGAGPGGAGGGRDLAAPDRAGGGRICGCGDLRLRRAPTR